MWSQTGNHDFVPWIEPERESTRFPENSSITLGSMIKGERFPEPFHETGNLFLVPGNQTTIFQSNQKTVLRELQFLRFKGRFGVDSVGYLSPLILVPQLILLLMFRSIVLQKYRRSVNLEPLQQHPMTDYTGEPPLPLEE